VNLVQKLNSSNTADSGRYVMVAGFDNPNAANLYTLSDGFSTSKITQTFDTVVGNTYKFPLYHNALEGSTASAMNVLKMEVLGLSASA
jgi:hypothetical protein